MTAGNGRMAVGDPSLEHLRAKLEDIEERVRLAVDRRRKHDADPDDRFRGLYLPDARIDSLFEQTREPLWTPPRATPPSNGHAAGGASLGASRLHTLAGAFGLDAVDIDMLIVTLAPDLDQRFEQLYGYLNDDVTRRRATIGLALELAGSSPMSRHGRARLSPGGPLVSGGLVLVEDGDRPYLTRSLRTPDRVTSFLLGGDEVEDALWAVLDREAADTIAATWPILERAVAAGISPIYVHDAGAGSGLARAAAAVAAVGLTAVSVDLGRVAATGNPVDVLRGAIRETRLHQGVLVAGMVDALQQRPSDALAVLAEAPCPIVMIGAAGWDPGLSATVPLIVDVPSRSLEERSAGWSDALRAQPAWVENPSLDASAVALATTAYRLTPSQIVRAARAAALRARSEGRPIGPDDLRSGARAQNAAGLERLARRVEPRATWDDLVLPADSRPQLRELAARARQRDRVLDEWGVGGGASRGRGITALFSGESGTGKTLTAEVISGELGLDLYVIDLATVVDKYIGETEKNLDRIFAEADRINGVLLFDEADAIFGKRSEVRDARDRYANVEVAYLLQRMERFDGLAILTTNLRANLDEAFTRRIDAIVDFPMPDEPDRLALWRMHLPPKLPQAEDIDLAFLASRFRLSGGNIRNVCLTAAFLAADAGRAVAMRDLIRGTELEYRKLGRLTVEDEFGPYLAVVAAERAAR